MLKDVFIIIGKADSNKGIQREELSICWLISQVAAMDNAEPICQEHMSQEPRASSGLAHSCRVPKLLAIFYCFPRQQAGSWVGTEPMPMWGPGEDVATEPLCQALHKRVRLDF